MSETYPRGVERGHGSPVSLPPGSAYLDVGRLGGGCRAGGETPAKRREVIRLVINLDSCWRGTSARAGKRAGRRGVYVVTRPVVAHGSDPGRGARCRR